MSPLFNFGNNSVRNAKTKFPRIYTTADFFTSDKTCQPNQWNKVGEVVVPAQQEITFGANDPIGGSSVAGRTVYIKLVNTSNVQLHGKIRLVLNDANELGGKTVLEESTRKLDADQNDRTKAVVLPEFSKLAREDDRLQVYFYPDDSSAVTVDQNGTDTLMLIPVTVYQ